MSELAAAIRAHPEVLKWFVACVFGLIGLILFIIAAKFRWLSSLSFGRAGVRLEGNTDKQFQSGTFNKLLDDQIHKLDLELTGYAIQKANDLKRCLTRQLIKEIHCISTRRALIAALRMPIYECCRSNNFKYELRPENIRFFVDRLMKDVQAEYEDFAIDQNESVCPITSGECVKIPPLNEMIISLETNVLADWAFPLRRKQIDICEKKISLYRQYIQSYTEIGDTVRIKVAERCIEKNLVYIKALGRKPVPGEL